MMRPPRDAGVVALIAIAAWIALVTLAPPGPNAL